jgi:2,4-dienoyl-CoA reductase-like NADH-dependent reductase (Old Yellow Enzyme family)
MSRLRMCKPVIKWVGEKVAEEVGVRMSIDDEGAAHIGRTIVVMEREDLKRLIKSIPMEKRDELGDILGESK